MRESAHYPKVASEKERQVKTYAELWHTSLCLLEKGIADSSGSHHQFMASLVFTAFTLEAALNHVGQSVFSCWQDLERLAPRKKLNVLAERIGVEVDYGRPPWLVMNDLFGFRNDIAHGKSEIMRSNEVLPLREHTEENFHAYVMTRWESYCTQRNAEKAREDVEKIVRALYEKAQLEDDYPFTRGSQLGTATAVSGQ